jgi:hypothetical protein
MASHNRVILRRPTTMTSQLAERQTVAALPSGRGRGSGGQPAGWPLPVGRCAVPGRGDQVGRTRLMYRRDWYLVPKQLRDRRAGF